MENNKNESHDTHILSSSSTDEHNLNKTNLELILSRQKESEYEEVAPLAKINIKELFNTIDERKQTKIIELDGNDEENEEDIEIINYYKNINKLKDNRKNITQNLKNWLIKRKNMQEIKTETFEFKTENKNTDNKNEENDINNNDEINKKENENKDDEITDGNSINRNNDKNSKDINTNRENKTDEEINKKINNETNEENEGNKESNLNENNEKSINHENNNEANNKDTNKNINDTNLFDSQDLDNKNKNNGEKQNKKGYKESNFNFCLVDKDNENEEKKDFTEESKEIKNLVDQKIDSDDENNFNSSDGNDFIEEDENLIDNNTQNNMKKINNNKVYKRNNGNNNKNNINKNKGKKNLADNKNQKIIKNKYNIRDKNKSNSKNKYKDNKNYLNNNNNKNKNIRAKTKENEKIQNKKININKKLRNQIIPEKNKKNKNNNNKIKMKSPDKESEILIPKNMNFDNLSYIKQRKTTGDISTKNNLNNKLFSFASPKHNYNNRMIKREMRLHIPRKCYFTKTIIQMDSEQFKLFNEKIRLMKEKNKIFYHRKNNYNPILENKYYKEGIKLYDEINNNKFIDLDYENNNTQNYLNNWDISKSNNPQRTFINRDINNYMNNRLISPNILINRHAINIVPNRKKFQKKLTDMPLSPYLLNKYNLIQKPLNKSNSAMGIFNNSNKKQNNNKFPNIFNIHNPLKTGNSNYYAPNTQDDINLNFFKTNTIFNFNPKNNLFIPILKNRNLEDIQSANIIQKFKNSNFKNIEVSTPISVDLPNRITLDMKNFHNTKKNHPGDKGYGRHFGNEKDCPVCQSVSMKCNYNMKNMHYYHQFIKQRDQDTIKLNKEQFLQELKQPNTKSQKMEADIMKEIKQFINYSKKAENMNNNFQDDASIINSYFGL